MEGRASLLVVDDERGPAESLRMIFQPSYHVYTASGGQQAIEILQSTPIDVVTLDLRMPVMSGVEVMEHIKAFDADIEVIIVTGHSSLDSAIKGLRHGAFDYISKPFDVPQITDLVRRAAARRRANLRARRTKEDFLANLSHELRTPLNAIIGYSAILAEELQRVARTDQRAAFERIQINSIELLSLVDGVLLLNALDAGEIALNIRPFNLGDTVARAVEKFQALAKEKNLLLRAEVATDALAVISDEEKVERVLWGLLDNAVKFTAAGSVSVVVRRASQRGAVEIEVSDTGIGMQREEIVRALEGLSQADASARRRFRGLGLGLRIATRLIELLGGDLRVRSEAAQGTQSFVTIPVRPVVRNSPLIPRKACCGERLPLEGLALRMTQLEYLDPVAHVATPEDVLRSRHAPRPSIAGLGINWPPGANQPPSDIDRSLPQPSGTGQGSTWR
jgi:signal transduction histidine kinase